MSISIILIFAFLLVVLIVILVKRFGFALARQSIEIDEVELGIGIGSITFKPNNKDIEVAYQLWVELMTRKLGLPFDESDDVISEVYSSWYEFFKITRELIKAIPVSQIANNTSTQTLVTLSIEVLNKAIRPHLTKWQARFKYWKERDSIRNPNKYASPQEWERKYPEYASLVSDMKKTNAHLLAYAKLLSKIVDPDLHTRVTTGAE